MEFLPAVPIVGDLLGLNNRVDKEAQAQREHAQRLAEIKAANEATMQREKLAHEQRQSELARLAKEKEIKLKQEGERQKLAHDKEMERLKNEEEKKKRDHTKKLEQEKKMFEEKIKKMWIDAKNADRHNQEKQRDHAVAQIGKELDRLNKQIDTQRKVMESNKKELKQIDEDLVNQDDKIKHFNKEYKLKEMKRKLSIAERAYKADDDEISAAIKKTGQREDNVGRFLGLTHALIGQTMSSQQYADKLDAHLQTFHTMISNECRTKLSIESLFTEKRLQRFIPLLEKRGNTECQDLVCKDDGEFNEILSYLQLEVDRQMKEWYKSHPNDQDGFELFLSDGNLRKFQAQFRENGISSLDDVKMMEGEDIEEIMDEVEMKGLFRKKFKRAINAAKEGKFDSQDNGDEKKNDDDQEDETEIRPEPIQQREIRLLRTICTETDEWKTWEQQRANSARRDLSEMSPILVTFFDKIHRCIMQAQKMVDYNPNLTEQQIETINVFIKNAKKKAIKLSSSSQSGPSQSKAVQKYDNQQRDQLVMEGQALQAAVVVDINVVQWMEKELDVSPTTARVIPLVTGIEWSVKQILMCQAQIRQCVKLAEAVLQLKPANMTHQSTQKLWKAVDDGIVQIMKNSIVMNKASAEYFGLFLELNRSFLQFQSMMEQNNEIQLFVALEDARRDIHKFGKFTKDFNKRVQRLSDEAMNVIANCVTVHIGQAQFESRREARVRSERDYKDAKKAYDTLSVELDAKLYDMKEHRANDRAERERLNYLDQTLKRNLESMSKYVKDYTEQQSKLMALNFGAFDKDSSKNFKDLGTGSNPNKSPKNGKDGKPQKK